MPLGLPFRPPRTGYRCTGLGNLTRKSVECCPVRDCAARCDVLARLGAASCSAVLGCGVASRQQHVGSASASVIARVALPLGGQAMPWAPEGRPSLGGIRRSPCCLICSRWWSRTAARPPSCPTCGQRRSSMSLFLASKSESEMNPSSRSSPRSLIVSAQPTLSAASPRDSLGAASPASASRPPGRPHPTEECPRAQAARTPPARPL